MVPSLNVPSAVNCCVAPLAIDTLVGVPAIDCSTAVVPVTVEGRLSTPPSVAAICAVPGPWPVANPVFGPMATTPALLVVHATSLVTSCVPPSLNVPVAVNCCVPPAASVASAGVTAIDCNVA